MGSDDRHPVLGDEFDRVVRNLTDLPDVTKTDPRPLRTVARILGTTQTWIVQTYRQREVGDTILVEFTDGQRHLRLAIPPDVADTIARQRDALTAKVRRKIGRRQAEERKAAGIQPGFMKNPNRGRKAGKKGGAR